MKRSRLYFRTLDVMDISNPGPDLKTFGHEGETFLQQLYIDADADSAAEKIKALKERLEIRKELTTVNGHKASPQEFVRALEYEVLVTENLVLPIYI